MAEPERPFSPWQLLTDEQKEKIKVWRDEQDAFVLQQQQEHNAKIDADASLTEDEKEASRAFIVKDAEGNDRPYYGAIGGVLTYCFTPTSMGMIVVVQHGGTKAELNITDYNW